MNVARPLMIMSGRMMMVTISVMMVCYMPDLPPIMVMMSGPMTMAEVVIALPVMLPVMLPIIVMMVILCFVIVRAMVFVAIVTAALLCHYVSCDADEEQCHHHGKKLRCCFHSHWVLKMKNIPYTGSEGKRSAKTLSLLYARIYRD
jgi:hypothetical protein